MALVRLKQAIAFASLLTVFLIAAPASAQQSASSISQYGITWTFSQPVRYGQFVNGDYWIIGPATVVSVSPSPGVAPANEVNDLGPNRWGDTGVRADSSRRNGSMVVMAPGPAQGYDSRGRTYRARASITFPYTLDVDRSLISSISNVTVPNLQMFHQIMWRSEKRGLQVLDTAAVLTSLAEAPPDDAFRPTYIGSEKRLYRLSTVRWDRLLKLKMDPSQTPSWAQFERYFERPWLDHLNGNWHGQSLLPVANQPAYGREIARIVSIGSLMLHLDVPQERKRKLLIGMLQYGIDLRGIVEAGGYWNEGGGHTSGRKWPILLAGLMFDDERFADMPVTARFQEDTQTYYGQGWAGQTALWQMVEHHGARAPYMEREPGQWRTFDGGWAETSESYRLCCTIRVWPGQTLAALLMGAKGLWNHDAYFANVEDWMREEDLYARRRGVPRPPEEGSSADAFVTAMWRRYRSAVPPQKDGTIVRMWNAHMGAWAPNSKPVR